MRNLIILSFFLLALPSCTESNKLQMVSNTGFTQGTTYSVRYLSEGGVNYHDSVRMILERIDYVLSTYRENSEINKFNSNDSSFKIHPYFLSVLNESQRIARETEGAFDPTLGPLISAWGFGAERKQTMSISKVDSLKSLCGYTLINMNKAGVPLKLRPEVQLNFNAIAQGYTVDLIAGMLDSVGVVHYMVEVGGELRCKGLNAKKEVWKIGIDKPQESLGKDRFQTIIQLENKALATSGNYRKFEVDSITGIRYAHTINPSTGYPVRHSLLSVSIVAENAMEADAYATAFMVMGEEKSKRFLETHPDLDALLISASRNGGFRVFTTPGFRKMELD